MDLAASIILSKERGWCSEISYIPPEYGVKLVQLNIIYSPWIWVEIGAMMTFGSIHEWNNLFLIDLAASIILSKERSWCSEIS